MKNAGYFIGFNTKHLGEGGVEITEKTKEELLLEQNRFEEEKQNLLNKGYKLFKSPDVLSCESYNAIYYFNREDYTSGAKWESDVDARRYYLLKVYGLYLVPEEEIQNVPIGTLLVSSIDREDVDSTEADRGLKALLGLTLPKSGTYDAFVSYKHIDEDRAQKVYNFLQKHLKEVFLIK